MYKNRTEFSFLPLLFIQLRTRLISDNNVSPFCVIILKYISIERTNSVRTQGGEILWVHPCTFVTFISNRNFWWSYDFKDKNSCPSSLPHQSIVIFVWGHLGVLHPAGTDTHSLSQLLLRADFPSRKPELMREAFLKNSPQFQTCSFDKGIFF